MKLLNRKRAAGKQSVLRGIKFGRILRCTFEVCERDVRFEFALFEIKARAPERSLHFCL